MGVAQGATGSCYVEVGETKVMCAVYGPRPPHRAETFQDTGMLECEVTIAPFATTRRRREVRDPAERALAAIVEQALVRDYFQRWRVHFQSLIRSFFVFRSSLASWTLSASTHTQSCRSPCT